MSACEALSYNRAVCTYKRPSLSFRSYSQPRLIVRHAETKKDAKDPGTSTAMRGRGMLGHVLKNAHTVPR